MGFIESFTGYTVDGIATREMPEQIRLVYSIKNHLQQLINVRKGSRALFPDMGIETIPDIFTSIPPWIKSFDTSLKEMFLKYDPRLEAVYTYNWHINKKKLLLLCRLVVVVRGGKPVRFEVTFGGIGNGSVSLLAAGNEE